jgi:hypothetical protein
LLPSGLAGLAIPIGKFSDAAATARCNRNEHRIRHLGILHCSQCSSEKRDALQDSCYYRSAAGLIQAISTLILASLGFGYWALVLGNLSFSLVATILDFYWERQRFGWPRLFTIRNVLIYRWYIIVGSLSWSIYNDGDFTIAGRVPGQAPLGAYALAWTLANTPLEQVNRVTSIFAAVRTDHIAFRRYLWNIPGALSLVVFLPFLE